MSTPPLVFDLQARRIARPRDRGQIVQDIIEGTESLHAHVSGWPVTYLRESHIIGVERSLVALLGELIALRAYVPAYVPAKE